MRGGSEDHPIEFRVERDFDGGSFSNRRVVASQQGRPILNLAASFHQREPGFAHQDAMPDVIAPGPWPGCCSPPAPCRMAAKAEGMSRAAPQARPECTPAAAYRSG